jgi:diaminohydroxyphosphoribosylaminopyrimidine deaminase/5-amino-6-(5-phosphoribosylamino)uracil reductase
MKRVLQLAEKGKGMVAPNPLVGCVIVKNNTIISEGYHEIFGKEHAEVNAINKLAENFDFTDCTLYVNLEPCSHFGKTPPCSDLIIKKKFKTVVIANKDVNPLVSGKGIQKLIDHKIEVIEGVLAKEALKLNKRFFTFFKNNRPYIILKWAETKDGFIFKTPLPINKNENWITCEESKKLVHKWRAEEQAIMVGTNTVLNDNPQLTTRLVVGKNPIRIIIDKTLKISSNAEIFKNNAEVIVFNNIKNDQLNHVQFVKIKPDEFTITNLFKKLAELKIQSVIIEGGTKLLQSVIDINLWDEARIFVGEKQFGSGIKAPIFEFDKSTFTTIGTDRLYLIEHD